MNKILIVAGLTLVAVVFFILGIRMMVPDNEGGDANTVVVTQPAGEDTATTDEAETTDDNGPWFSIVENPMQAGSYLFSLNEPVEVELKDCNDSLFPSGSPYLVDFGDGQVEPMAARNSGYAIEGGYCSLFWETSHEYSTEGTYEAKLMKDGTTVSTKPVVIGSDSR